MDSKKSRTDAIREGEAWWILPSIWVVVAGSVLALGGATLTRWLGVQPRGPVLSVAACGDVMIQNIDGGRSMGDEKLMAFMAQAAPWFKSADIGFVNLEGPVGGSEPKSCSSSNCWRFKQGPMTGQALAAVGVNAVALANNHTADMGASGQASTLSAMDQAGIRGAGLFARPSVRWTQAGLSVELLAMTANGFAPDFRRPEALEAIRQAKARSDIVILSVHMGCEGERCARLQGGKEMFLGEDRGDPKVFGDAAVDAGADLVLGSGPHVPRGMALRSGHLIAYSLGNCAAGPGISTAGKAGWAPVLRAELDAQGRLSGWDVGSFVGDGSKMAWDPSQRALRWMSKATELDSGALQWEALRRLWKPASVRNAPFPEP